MSVETKRIFHINDEATELNNLQLCVEDVVDPITGFKMWAGRDGDGNITKWLALDKAARVTSLEATTGLSVTSGSTITASQVALACAGEIRFTDEHTNGAGSNWSTAYMPFSESDYEWLVARALLGDTEGSVLALIAAAAAYGGSTGDWDDVYNYGGSGGGRSAAVDAGPWLATVPVGGSTGAMSLVNNATGNTAGILAIQNNATLSTGLSIDLSGATSGDSYDYDEMGAKVWTSGSVTMGNGYTSPSYGYSRAYSRSFWENDPYITGGSAAQEIRAESGATWQHYAYFRASVAQNDGYEAGRAYIKSTAATYINCNNLYVNDGNVSGSTWPGDEILFTYNTAEVDALDALVDAAGTNPSLGGAILAAASSSGSLNAAYGIGNDIDIDDDTPVTISKAFGTTGNILLIDENSEDSDTCVVIDRGISGQMPAMDFVGGGNAGHQIRMFEMGYLIGENVSNGNWAELHLESTSSAYSAARLKALRAGGSYYSTSAAQLAVIDDGTSGKHVYLNNIDYFDFNDIAPIRKLKNVTWGTPTGSIVSGSTLTLNFSTGKDAQKGTFSANITTLSLTAPTSGLAKGLTVELTNSGGAAYTVGGGTGWNGVTWSKNGTDLGSSSVSVPAGDTLLLMLYYNGTNWRGSFDEF